MLAVISDVHSNIVALRAVLDDIESKSVSKIFCCGDSVYDPQIADVFDRNNIQSVRGNCDEGSSLPFVILTDGTGIVHGSIREPESFHPLDSYSALARDFEHMKDINILFAGHTHIAGAFMYKAENLYKINDKSFELNDNNRYIINAGSAGQPRDRDPRASYVLYDNVKNKIFMQRVEYDIEAAQKHLRSIGIKGIDVDRIVNGW